MQKPSRNDTLLRIARLVAASHGLSQLCCGYA
jgi:predicted secreted protein